ncbi:MAG TPA: hypothetical protein VGJ91_07645 [Polyangiaceae bacterium]
MKIDDVDTAMRTVHTGLATLKCPDELQGTGLVTSWHEQQRYLALARAEQLYVNLATSQYIARVAKLGQAPPRRMTTKMQRRWLEFAREALQAAQDDAREVFWAVARGEVEP